MDLEVFVALQRLARPALKFVALALAGLVMAAPVQAKLYKWIDENGNVTYSQQKPPPGREAKTIELKGIESPDPDAGNKLDALKDRAETVRKDREFAENESQAGKARENRLKENCKIARENVRILKTAARVQDKGEDGQAVYLDDSGKQAKLAQAEQQVKDYCN